MKRTFAVLLFILVVIFAAPGLTAQTTNGPTPWSTVQGGFDTVSLNNLNVAFQVLVRAKAGRGEPFVFAPSYSSTVWQPVTSGSTKTWQMVANQGWRRSSELIGGNLIYTSVKSWCVDGWTYDFTFLAYVDPHGVTHPFTNATAYSSGSSQTCAPGGTYSGFASDNSGYRLVDDNTLGGSTPNWYVQSPSGETLQGKGLASVVDSNGNKISMNNSNQYIDTLGTVALSYSTDLSTYTYTNPAGASVSVHFNSSAYSVKTNFGCSGVGEYTGTLNLISSVTFPDGSAYSITYEPTPGFGGYVTGRIAAITLPTGGTISYAYTGTNNGIICADGTPAGLTRTTPDGTWQYSRTQSGSNWVTTVTDPASNQSVYTFSGGYVTQVQAYQGSTQSGTLLLTTTTCYNGNTTNCGTATVASPVTQTSVITQWPNGQTTKTDTLFNPAGLPIESDHYDYGSGAAGALLSKTLETYASLGNNILNRPASIIVQDAAGNVLKQTTFGYDESAVVATTGTPQHQSISGSRGNRTSIHEYIDATHYLTRSFTYKDTGTVAVATDLNGQTSSFQYSACGNSFPTQTTLPLSLTSSFTWNCTGGTISSSTGVNSGVATTAYSDPNYWRVTSITDAESNVTSISYPSTIQTESALTFNGNTSTVDNVGTRDSQGRLVVSQRRQAPGASNFDSTETDYDSLGRISRVSLPYSATVGQKNSTAPGATVTYDALNRATQVSKSGGSVVTYTYVGNDQTTQISPTPTGESAKSNQYEYDGLGRLTSVCEINSLSGSGTCGQSNAVTGFWTRYTYDAAGRVTSIIQNAQSQSTQTRSFQYDRAGRLLSETEPETGTTSYTYDSDSTCGTYTADLVKKVDNAGYVTCYSYDVLHRILSITFPNSPSTPSKYYVYDSASLNGTAMSNPKGHLVEAYTGSPNSKTTDEYLSYSPLGRVTDVYESTPHSGGYYHVAVTYWANGVVNQRSALGGQLTYGLDGEGRIKTISSLYGQNPVTNVGYTTAGAVSTVTYGSGDSDNFSFDPNTNLLTQYAHTVGATSVTGTLTWNQNQTLASLSIVDGFNSANNQTCSYSYDPLFRLGSANCGAAWNQTFTFDGFGNISKSGSSAFQPTYNQATNRIASLPGATISYDADGNLTSDGSFTYSWNAEPRVTNITSTITGTSVGLTYDALGRMVEQSTASGYTEVLYDPTGSKLALMNGQSLVRAYTPTPGGGVTVFLPTGSYYRHSDWLGSSRLTSNSDGTLKGETDYAPFGEAYGQNLSPDLSFAGGDQDTISGLYDFQFREYSPGQGRWVSPDALHANVFDADDPKSLNLYAYVRNGPCSSTDPLGLDIKCTITVNIGASGLQQGQLDAIEGGIQKLFAQAEVGVEFTTDSANAVDTLTIGSYNIFAWLRSAGYPQLGLTLGQYSWVDSEQVRHDSGAFSASGPQFLAGMEQVATHEITHALINAAFYDPNPPMGIHDTSEETIALDNSNHAGIWALGPKDSNGNPEPGLFSSNDYGLGNPSGGVMTEDQKRAILSACEKLQPVRRVLPPTRPSDLLGWWSSLYFSGAWNLLIPFSPVRGVY